MHEIRNGKSFFFFFANWVWLMGFAAPEVLEQKRDLLGSDAFSVLQLDARFIHDPCSKVVMSHHWGLLPHEGWWEFDRFKRVEVWLKWTQESNC